MRRWPTPPGWIASQMKSAGPSARCACAPCRRRCACSRWAYGERRARGAALSRARAAADDRYGVTRADEPDGRARGAEQSSGRIDTPCPSGSGSARALSVAARLGRSTARRRADSASRAASTAPAPAPAGRAASRGLARDGGVGDALDKVALAVLVRPGRAPLRSSSSTTGIGRAPRAGPSTASSAASALSERSFAAVSIRRSGPLRIHCSVSTRQRVATSTPSRRVRVRARGSLQG